MNTPIILKGNTKLLKPIITEIMAMHQLLENLDIESNAGSDSEMYPNRRYHPQIRLFFKEDVKYRQNPDNLPHKSDRRQTARLSFRLMNEYSHTITNAELTRIGQSIKSLFGINDGYLWDKGKELYCYADWSKGYQLQILAQTNTQARDLVVKILSIQNHTPDWVFFTKHKNEAENERYPETIQTRVILGEAKELALVRPLRKVRFTYADARVHKLIPPIIVYDRTNVKVGALVR